MNQQILEGPGGIEVHLDKNQVFHDDPGNGTPALVMKRQGRKEYCSTYNCACGEGELLGDDGVYTLSDRQLQWLNDQEELIGNFLEW